MGIHHVVAYRMSMKRVSASEASEMMTQDGYTYVDVRSIPEFEAGHPEGAYNIPIMQMGPRGMAPNQDFLVFEGSFAKDAKLILGCQSGGRSLQAAQILQAQGFSDVVDQRAGFGGVPAMPGAAPEPGWRALGLPVATQAAEGRAYDTLAAAAKR